MSKSDSSGSNSYLRASSGLIGSIVADSGATYTPGVSEKRGTTSTFYHADIKNSVEQTSTSQTVAASKGYDAFGNEVSSSGPWQGPFQYGGSFGYHTDTDYGLKHLGARYYDSTTGRFLTRDPIKDGRNWYVYANGCPTSYVDEDGLAPMGPPPIPVPGDPSNSWKWNPDPNNSRGGTWGPARPIPGQSQASASWDERLGHWDVEDGKGGRQRYTKAGKPISAEYAHGRGAWHHRRGWGSRKYWRNVRGIGGKVVKALLLWTLITEGPEAAAREAVFADEVEWLAELARDAGNSWIEERQNDVRRSYSRRAGITAEDEAEYGL